MSCPTNPKCEQFYAKLTLLEIDAIYLGLNECLAGTQIVVLIAERTLLIEDAAPLIECTALLIEDRALLMKDKALLMEDDVLLIQDSCRAL